MTTVEITSVTDIYARNYIKIQTSFAFKSKYSAFIVQKCLDFRSKYINYDMFLYRDLCLYALLHCTVKFNNTVQCTHCTLFAVHMYTTLYTLQCTHCTYLLYICILHCILYSVQCTLYSLRYNISHLTLM